jgi:phytoene synthase
MRLGTGIDINDAASAGGVFSPRSVLGGSISGPGPTLARSRDFCEQLTRAQARNFYYGLKLLPRPKRMAMFALYAYMRLVDDIADAEDSRSQAQRLAELDAWRLQTRAVLEGRSLKGHAFADHVLWPAFGDVVGRYGLPAYIFDDVISGQRQDLEPASFADFPQLREYCYRVAGTVGVASIYIWGFEGGADTERLAIERGIAFQLTNILRDLREDGIRGRTYLPTDELTSAGMTAPDVRSLRGGEQFRRLMGRQITRAEAYYDKSRELESRIERDCRPTLIAMTEIYRGLLKKVACEPERVLRERVSLSLFSKLRIGWRATRAR